MPSTLFRCSEQTEGCLGSESSKVLVKQAHRQICSAVSTDLEEAETTRCRGTRRSRARRLSEAQTRAGDNRLNGGSGGAFSEPL